MLQEKRTGTNQIVTTAAGEVETAQASLVVGDTMDLGAAPAARDADRFLGCPLDSL